MVDNKKQLTKNALKGIDKADEFNALIISAISIWEIAMLTKNKKAQWNLIKL